MFFYSLFLAFKQNKGQSIILPGNELEAAFSERLKQACFILSSL
jgi:hypothetical protein